MLNRSNLSRTVVPGDRRHTVRAWNAFLADVVDGVNLDQVCDLGGGNTHAQPCNCMAEFVYRGTHPADIASDPESTEISLELDFKCGKCRQRVEFIAVEDKRVGSGGGKSDGDRVGR